MPIFKHLSPPLLERAALRRGASGRAAPRRWCVGPSRGRVGAEPRARWSRAEAARGTAIGVGLWGLMRERGAGSICSEGLSQRPEDGGKIKD